MKKQNRKKLEKIHFEIAKEIGRPLSSYSSSRIRYQEEQAIYQKLLTLGKMYYQKTNEK